MSELNFFNIDQIAEDVRSQEIGFSHLYHDLVDHICCDIEYEMKQGLSFDEAYRKVKDKIGFRGLKKIQEETLFAVDTKYRYMKMLMKISGVAGTMMIGFAASLKILHLPLAGVLLFLGALMLAFLFLPSALIVLWKETKSAKKIVLFVSAFFSGVFFIFGMLFKIQHWPGAAFVISMGILTGVILFIPSLLIHLFRDQEKKHKRMIYITGAFSIIAFIIGFWFRIMHWPLAGILISVSTCVLFFFTLPWYTRVQWKNETYTNGRFIFMVIAPLLFIIPGALVNLNLERSYEEEFFIRLEKQEALVKLQEYSNNRFIRHFNDTLNGAGMECIHSATDELRGIIRSIKHSMVLVAETPAGKPNPALVDLTGSIDNTPISYRTLQRPFHPDPASLMLLPGCKARSILEQEIAKYRGVLVQKLGNVWYKEYESLLESSDYLPGGEIPRNDLLLLPNLNSLSLLESAILITESAALKKTASASKEL
jgi:hypothetical protein